jgi:hypothetical protein
MGLLPDECAVQELAAASSDPAFGGRVHARRPDVAKHSPSPGIGKDRVEHGGEVRAAVADHELDPVRLPAEVHDQVRGLLGWSTPRSDAVGLENTIVAVTCFFSQEPGAVTRGSGTRV